jgi:hypothetical protein
MGTSMKDFSKPGGTLDNGIKNITKEIGEVVSEFGKYKDSADSAFKGITDKSKEYYNAFSGKMTEY